MVLGLWALGSMRSRAVVSLVVGAFVANVGCAVDAATEAGPRRRRRFLQKQPPPGASRFQTSPPPWRGVPGGQAPPWRRHRQPCHDPAAGPVLSGFDVVAYFSLDAGAAAVAGSAAHNATYGGYTFYFSTEANRATFETRPYAYVPQFGGFCSWGVAEEKYWSKTTLGPKGGPNTWAIIDGKLYIFMFDRPRDKFLGALRDDDLDASGNTTAYVRDAAARWAAWFGDAPVFNTACFWWDTSTDGGPRPARPLSP